MTNLTADELVAEQANIARQINALAVEAEQEFSDIDVSAANGLPITVELTEMNDDYTYVYSQTEGEDAQVAMYETEPLDMDEVAVLSEQDIQETYLKEGTNEVTDLLLGMARTLTGCNGPCTYNKDIDGGLGAKLLMKYNNGNILSFSVVTSDLSKTMEQLGTNGNILGGECYLYGGFQGTCNGKECISDLGLVYQKMKDTNTWAWKPFYRVTYYKTSTTQVSIQSDKYNLNATDENGNDGQVWGANGYIPGEKIDIQVRIDAVGNKSDVVLCTAGYAFHSSGQCE